jgi:hypothetical protein
MVVRPAIRAEISLYTERIVKVLITLEIIGLLTAAYAALLYSQEFTPIYISADLDPYSDILAESGKWYTGPNTSKMERSG